MRLALFDLDHTLIPFDSGLAWLRFLAGRGALGAEVAEGYLEACRGYVAGRCGVEALHRALLAPLAAADAAQWAAWRAGFEAEMAPRLPPAMVALVARHRAAGDRCALVTATTRPVSESFARLFGVPALVATEPRRPQGDGAGAYGAEIDGLPCHGAHKPAHVARWLAAQGLALADFERSWFYSDSSGDLPLLRAVTDPVAVRPDARLRAEAVAQGWPVLEAEVAHAVA